MLCTTVAPIVPWICAKSGGYAEPSDVKRVPEIETKRSSILQKPRASRPLLRANLSLLLAQSQRRRGLDVYPHISGASARLCNRRTILARVTKPAAPYSSPQPPNEAIWITLDEAVYLCPPEPKTTSDGPSIQY